MTRLFETGATRDADNAKLDYEGFISPLVWERFAEYMHECRLRNVPPGDTIRASDNWQKGISFDSYMKSGFRHFMDWWKGHRERHVNILLEDALCALLFNVQGYLHELLQQRRSNLTLSDIPGLSLIETKCKCAPPTK